MGREDESREALAPSHLSPCLGLQIPGALTHTPGPSHLQGMGVGCVSIKRRRGPNFTCCEFIKVLTEVREVGLFGLWMRGEECSTSCRRDVETHGWWEWADLHSLA